MRHIVALYEEVQKIHMLKKQIEIDPQNKVDYDNQIWKLYTKVTAHKDAYYAERDTSVPNLRNAYITFRSMEGKQRALQAYETPVVTRVCAE